jgi:hypothetical protein
MCAPAMRETGKATKRPPPFPSDGSQLLLRGDCLLQAAGAGVDVADLDEIVDDAVSPERDDAQIVEPTEAHRRLGKGRSGQQQRHRQRGHQYL